MTTRAIVFDFDGVLVESVDVKTRAFETLFAKESVRHRDQIVSYHLQHGGVSRFEKFKTIYRDILRRPLSKTQFNRLCDRFARLVVDEVVASPWVKGAREFLDTFKNRYDFHIVTGTPQPEIELILKSRRIRHYFQQVLGSPRSKAVLLKQLLKTARLQTHQAVFIGDAPTDWSAAQEIGVPFIWRKPPQGVSKLQNYKGPCMASLEVLNQHIGTARPVKIRLKRRSI